MYISAEMTKTKPGNLSPGITSSSDISEQSTSNVLLDFVIPGSALPLLAYIP
jgi:hypothetical protein